MKCDRPTGESFAWPCRVQTDFRVISRVVSALELAERVGFEFTRKRSFNNVERTAGTVKQWKAVVSSANGSQSDHGPVITRSANEGGRTLMFYGVVSLSRTG
jgi:hypothetical protein